MRRVLCVVVAAAGAAIAAAPVTAEASASTTVLNVPASAAVSAGAKALIPCEAIPRRARLPDWPRDSCAIVDTGLRRTRADLSGRSTSLS